MILEKSWPLFRALLFQLDPEEAHALTLSILRKHPSRFGKMISPFTSCPPLPVNLAGVPLRGPVGLAAGLDKDGEAIPFWPALGFGSIEVGTVTMHPQPGNPRPRLHRLVTERSIINRMGFNNEGSSALAIRLRRLQDRGLWPVVPVGVNIGKSKITPIADAPRDYITSVRRLHGLCDWFTVNVSSPNTPGLRRLQSTALLRDLLPGVLEAASPTPVFLKLAPDLSETALREAVDLAIELGIHGLIATNTTTKRTLLSQDPNLEGGLSGRAIWPLAKACIQIVLDETHGRVPVVGVGGIETAAQVQELLSLGCQSVQLFSAFIFQGPSLPSRLHRALA